MDELRKNTEKTMLWQRFKKGDRAAFNDLLQEYYPLLLNYGVRLRVEAISIEDLLQDFFIDLWNKREGLGNAQNLNAYLFSSFRRRLFREKEKTSRIGLTELTEQYDFDVEFDIEAQLIARENRTENEEKLKKHLDKLTKRQREAIYLRFYQDLDNADVAQIMNINTHSIVNLVSDALRIMRQNWVVSLLICFSSFFFK